MGKIWIEVCLISARGLRRISSSFFKLQWFAVGWIDPNNKYCTTFDASGNGNPVWKTKFSVAVDASEMNFQELALFVEVHSREPVFLRSSLLGTANIVLKEFLDKYNAEPHEVSKPVEEVGSFQIWKRNSNKPRGFVDVSIRVSEEREEPSSSYAAANERLNPFNIGNGVEPSSRYGSVDSQRPYQAPSTFTYPEPNYPTPIPQNYSQSGIKLVSRNGPSMDSQHRPYQHATPQQSEPNYPLQTPQNYSQGGIKLVSRGGSSVDSQRRPNNNLTTSQQPEQSPQSYPHGGIKIVNRNGSSVDSQRRPNQNPTSSQQPETNNPMQAPLNNSNGGIKLVSRYGSSVDSQRPNQRPTTSQQPDSNNPIPIPSNYSQHYSSGGSTYQLTQTPQPPPPNTGYTPNFLPQIDSVKQSYMNMPRPTLPPSGHRGGEGAIFGMGLGAGALAAGAMIFGDDFMSGYDVPSNLPDPTPTLSTKRPFY